MNKEEFKENDAALYITCEDDLIKTSRKFMSIFGNYEFDKIRNIYRASHEFVAKVKKEKTEVDSESKQIIKDLFSDVLNESIRKTTSGMLQVIFKYSPENTLSAGEIQRQIKKFELQGINVKYLIIDYLDVLKPTLAYGNMMTDEYFSLGIITQELRTLSRIFGLPIITATQTSKLGDNVGRTLTNDIVGESYKKVKFSDFIYMQRMRDDLDIFSPEVSKYVFREGTEYNVESPNIVNLKEDLVSCLKPLEMRVSKSKEKGKGFKRFMLFCNKNLRLYNTVEEYFTDLTELKTNGNFMNKKLEKLQQLVKINSSMVHDELVPGETDLSSDGLSNTLEEIWGDNTTF